MHAELSNAEKVRIVRSALQLEDGWRDNELHYTDGSVAARVSRHCVNCWCEWCVWSRGALVGDEAVAKGEVHTEHTAKLAAQQALYALED